MTLPSNPLQPGSGDSDGKGEGTAPQVNIEHFHQNDIQALAQMAKHNPELANKIADYQHQQAIIYANSERLGMVMATVLGVTLVVGASWTFVGLGWWQSIMFVGIFLGISHVLRTLLKGEFSDTSWFSKILTRAPNTNGDNTP